MGGKMMINSIESDRLQKLIDRQKAYMEKLKQVDPENPSLKYLNSDITLLEELILPIVLCNTVTDYIEIRNFVTRSLRALERHKLAKKTNDIVLHIHLKDSGFDQPLAALASNMKSSDAVVLDMLINQKPESVYPVFYAEPEFHRIDYIERKTFITV